MSKETSIETYAQSAVWRQSGNHFWMENGNEYLVFDACDVNVDAVQAIQTTCGESCNEVLFLLLGANFKQFVAHMILEHGRGLFLAEYDDEEIELEGGKYYAYRIC